MHLSCRQRRHRQSLMSHSNHSGRRLNYLQRRLHQNRWSHSDHWVGHRNYLLFHLHRSLYLLSGHNRNHRFHLKHRHRRYPNLRHPGIHQNPYHFQYPSFLGGNRQLRQQSRHYHRPHLQNLYTRHHHSRPLDQLFQTGSYLTNRLFHRCHHRYRRYLQNRHRHNQWFLMG